MARALAGLPSRRSTLACALAAFVCAGALPARAADKSTKDKAAAEVADLQLEPLTAPAVAPPSPPAHWSTISGETVSPGPDLLSAELGFPGLSFGYARGLSDRADWGLKLDLLYGLYGTTTTQFGVGARVPLRLVAARREKITVLLHLDPGLVTY